MLVRPIRKEQRLGIPAACMRWSEARHTRPCNRIGKGGKTRFMANISLRNAPRAERRLWGQGGWRGASPANCLRATVESGTTHPRCRLEAGGAALAPRSVLRPVSSLAPTPSRRRKAGGAALAPPPGYGPQSTLLESRTDTLPSPQGGGSGASPAAGLRATADTLCVSHRHPPPASRRGARR